MGRPGHGVMGAAGHHHDGTATTPRWLGTDASYPCNQVAEPFATQCWSLQSQLQLSHNGNDWNATIAACAAAKLHAISCFEGLGRDIAAAVSDDPGGIIPLCGLAATEFQGDCVGGAVLAAINVHNSLTPGLLICAKAPETWKLDCYSAVGVMNGGDPNIERRRAACASVPAKYQARCSASE